MNPQLTLELAAANFVSEYLADMPSITHVYKGHENAEAADDSTGIETDPLVAKALPCVILEAENDIAEAIPFTLNFRGTLSVRVQADAKNTTDSDFRAMVQEAFSIWSIEELATRLSTYTDDFNCLFANLRAPSSVVRNGENWECSLSIDVVFAEADL